MGDYDEESVQAQREALALHESERRAVLETAAVAAAIAASVQEERHSRHGAERSSEQLARQMQSQEIAEADEELANAMESSEFEALTESLTSSTDRLKRARTEEHQEGAWDCQNCTFTNSPYKQICRACESPAPPNVLTFTKACTLKFGLEIEVVMPDGKRDGYSLESIARESTELGPRVDKAGYSHRTSLYWKIVTDASVKGNGQDRDLCFELVSPVLQGEGINGLGSLRALMANVRKLGIATNASCGFHVHVDATPGQEAVPEMGTLVGLKRVSQCYVAVENAFDLLVART